MPVDTKEIKKAIDQFEDDNFVDSEDILSKEFKKAKNDFFKKQLELENDVDPVEKEEETEEETEEDTTQDDD